MINVAFCDQEHFEYFEKEFKESYKPNKIGDILLQYKIFFNLILRFLANLDVVYPVFCFLI